jgi:ABC-type lipopolysaccharide export system ATPase subunit
MKHLLEIDSVYKLYEYRNILSDVYLKCETGDVIGVLGRNGTGKSTLLKIIFGIISAENKFIRIDHKIRNKAYIFSNEISYLPQDNFIPKHFRVSKAIRLFINKNKNLEFRNDDFIQNIYTKKVNQLSGGELRYLEIKLVLCNESKFALLDEPYNGISPILVKEINRLIIKYSNEKGIILTDHNYRNVLDVTNQLYVIKDCATKKLKDKEELIRYGYLKEGML